MYKITGEYNEILTQSRDVEVIYFAVDRLKKAEQSFTVYVQINCVWEWTIKHSPETGTMLR